MTRKNLMLALLIAVAPGITMSASVYKWTDDKGVTHFGDRQPVGADSETINVRSGTSSGSANSRPSPQQRLDELQEQQKESARQAQETAVEAARRKQREANCETAKTNLKIISTTARIRVEENGEQRYLTPDEIAEQKKKYEEIADSNCESGDPS